MKSHLISSREVFKQKTFPCTQYSLWKCSCTNGLRSSWDGVSNCNQNQNILTFLTAQGKMNPWPENSRFLWPFFWISNIVCHHVANVLISSYIQNYSTIMQLPLSPDKMLSWSLSAVCNLKSFLPVQVLSAWILTRDLRIKKSSHVFLPRFNNLKPSIQCHCLDPN